jgi:hypothetical protein
MRRLAHSVLREVSGGVGVSMKRIELMVAGLFTVFFGFMMRQTWELIGEGRAGEMGSGFWPALVLAAAGILSLGLFLSRLMRLKRPGSSPAKRAEPSAEPDHDPQVGRRKVLLSVICLLGYVVLLPWVGFPLATCLYVLAFMLALEERRKWILLASPVLVTALMILVFGVFITIPFPRGAGIFESLTRLLY